MYTIHTGDIYIYSITHNFAHYQVLSIIPDIAGFTIRTLLWKTIDLEKKAKKTTITIPTDCPKINKLTEYLHQYLKQYENCQIVIIERQMKNNADAVKMTEK
jgi:hypothetical protein